MKPTLKPPGTKRLKLNHVKLVSPLINSAYNFSLRRYTKVAARPASAPPDWGDAGGYSMGKHPGAAATQYLPPQVRGTIHLKLTCASD